MPAGRVWADVAVPLADPAPGNVELVPVVPLPVVVVLPAMPLPPEPVELVVPADLSRIWFIAASQHLPALMLDVDGLEVDGVVV